MDKARWATSWRSSISIILSGRQSNPAFPAARRGGKAETDVFSRRTRKVPGDIREGPYREVTLAAVFLGVAIGVMLVACFTYAGLLIGFTIGGDSFSYFGAEPWAGSKSP
jgi:hypothetical protein